MYRKTEYDIVSNSAPVTFGWLWTSYIQKCVPINNWRHYIVSLLVLQLCAVPTNHLFLKCEIVVIPCVLICEKTQITVVERKRKRERESESDCVYKYIKYIIL